MKAKTQRERTLFLTQFSILLAIEAVFCFTPLGSLPALGPIVATLMMVPVVITAILLGPVAGTLMGFCAGLFSFIVWTFITPPLSAAIAFVFTPVYSPGNFWSLVICFVPRTLGGFAAGAVFQALKRLKSDAIAYCTAGALGSLVNTVGVVLGIYFFFGGSYAEALGVAFSAMLGIVGTTIAFSGIPEAVICAVAGLVVCRPIRQHIVKKPAV